MWNIPKSMLEKPGRFENLKAIDILVYYDGPQVFTTKDSFDNLCLAMSVSNPPKFTGQEEWRERFLVVEIDSDNLYKLNKNQLSLRDAFGVDSNDNVHVVSLDVNGEVASCHSIPFGSIPEELLPAKGFTLGAAYEADIARLASSAEPKQTESLLQFQEKDGEDWPDDAWRDGRTGTLDELREYAQQMSDAGNNKVRFRIVNILETIPKE